VKSTATISTVHSITISYQKVADTMSDPSKALDQTDADNFYITEENRALRQQRDMLRAALVGLVGVDTRAELEQLEAVMRLTRAPAEDKAATIDAIHALIATLKATP